MRTGQTVVAQGAMKGRAMSHQPWTSIPIRRQMIARSSGLDLTALHRQVLEYEKKAIFESVWAADGGWLCNRRGSDYFGAVTQSLL